MLTLDELNNREAADAAQADATESQSDLIIRRNQALAAAQGAHPGWSTEQVRNYVRQLSPELFGISVDDGSTPTGEQAARNRERAELEVTSERKAAVEDYMLKNRCSHEVAWNRVRQSRPELFFTQAAENDEEAATQPVRNRVLNREALNAIQDGIDDLRQSNPAWTYERARNELRRLNPGLFGC
jgi:hypothetical protein